MGYFLKQTDSFERSLKSLLKENFQKSKKLLKEFQRILSEKIRSILENPQSCNNCLREPLKGGLLPDKTILMKIRFRFSKGLRGSSSYFRIIYLVDTENKTVILLVIYSHKQFESRPSDKQLRKMIEEALDVDDMD